MEILPSNTVDMEGWTATRSPHYILPGPILLSNNSFRHNYEQLKKPVLRIPLIFIWIRIRILLQFFGWFLWKFSMTLADFLLPGSGSGSGWPKLNGFGSTTLEETITDYFLCIFVILKWIWLLHHYPKMDREFSADPYAAPQYCL